MMAEICNLVQRRGKTTKTVRKSLKYPIRIKSPWRRDLLKEKKTVQPRKGTFAEKKKQKKGAG